MCTCVFSFEPTAQWPLLILSVRDEMRDRGFDPPRAWWSEHPHIVGPRDRRAGGTWIAVDTAHGVVSIVLNRRGDRPGATGSRGLLPLLAVTRPEQVVEMATSTAPANVLRFDASTAAWVRGEDEPPRWCPIGAGWHIVTSWDLDDARREKHVTLMESALGTGRPPTSEDEPDWTPWKQMLARDWEAHDVERRLTIIDDPDRPGYGTSAVTLVGIRADGAVAVDFCDDHPRRGRWTTASWRPDAHMTAVEVTGHSHDAGVGM